jgi:hypothetical protein
VRGEMLPRQWPAEVRLLMSRPYVSPPENPLKAVGCLFSGVFYATEHGLTSKGSPHQSFEAMRARRA